VDTGFDISVRAQYWAMIIGDRIRGMREEKKLSQTFPGLKWTHRPSHRDVGEDQLFYEGEEPPKLPNLPNRKSSNDVACGSVGKEARYLNKLLRLLSNGAENGVPAPAAFLATVRMSGLPYIGPSMD
jgi:hypothetical protein